MTDKAKELGDSPASGFGYQNGSHSYYQTRGLTKREYFAAAAMQGLIAQTSIRVDVNVIVDEAISCADALLEKLSLNKL